MKKRIIAFLLVVAMVCTLLPMAAFAEDDADGGTFGNNLTWSFKNGVLTIGGTGEMPDYSYVFSDFRDNVTKVVIENGVTRIGSAAFYYFRELKSVTIPDSVTSIGYNAFYCCTGLTSITIPDGVTRIESGAFEDCTELASVTIGNGLTSIGSDAFYNTGYANDKNNWEDGVLYIDSYLVAADSSIETAEIKAGTKLVADSAFYGCNNLTSAIIPDGITSLGDGMFYACRKLTSVSIPDSVTSIGDFAFRDCESLKNIRIPDNVASIGGRTFLGCSSLNSLDVSTANVNYTSYEGTLYSKDMTTLLTYPIGSTNTSFSVPSGVTSIEYSAFGGAKNLASVTLPDSVTEIGRFAFGECSSLTSVTIPDGVTSIEESTFADCSSLTSVTIPDSVTSIGRGAFIDCKDLTSVTIPDGVTCIWSWTFYGCSSLSNIIIPDSVTEIGEYNFYACDSLSDVYYTGTEEQWSEILIDFGNDPLLNAEIHYNFVPHVHSYTDVVTAPTCLEKGYMTYTCSCGDSYVDNYVDALGHNYINGVCTRCGDKDPNYKPPVLENPFVDVKDNAWYRDAVLWAYNHKPEPVTKGTDATHFSPDGVCSRGQVVAFLWRLAGSPEPSGIANPFVDVVNSGECAYYYKAILWAYENGVTNGVDATHFAPLAAMTRGQLVTFLWRASGSPDTSAYKNSFADVTNSGVCQYYYDGILWAAANGITTGTGGNLFEPNLTVTRCQVVTFLSRYAA